MRRPTINLRPFLLAWILLCLHFSSAHSQANCGTCQDVDFAVSCNNGINTVNDFGSTCTAMGCQVVPQQDFATTLSGTNVDLSEYCVDFTTPAIINGNCDFGLGAFARLNTTGFNPCTGTPVNTLYDAACNIIAPAGPLDGFSMPTWTEAQICPATSYTICFQYSDVTCPPAAFANGYFPELYYIEAEVPNVDFSFTAATCSGDPVTWTPNADCSGLASNSYTMEIYKWTGGCTVADLTFTSCGIDDIEAISPNLTLVQAGVTCEAPVSTIEVWDAICNSPCAPKTVTYFTIIRSADVDCDGDGLFEFSVKQGLTRYDVLVYPPQPITEVNAPSATVCSGTTGAVVVELGYDIDASGTLEGAEICASEIINAPANNTCASVVAALNMTWTPAMIATLTGAPPALGCYTAATDGAAITVLPAQPTAAVLPVGTVDCSGLVDGLAINIIAGDGVTVCNTKTFDIPASAGCNGADLNVNYTCTGAELATLFSAPATPTCYTTISGTQAVAVSPDMAGPTITCPADLPRICGQDLPVAATVLQGTDNCDPATTFTVTAVIDSPTPNFCAVNPEITRTYTVIDICGNESSCTQTFPYAQDTEAPTNLVCPPTVVDLQCNDPLPTAVTTIAAMDNCEGPSNFAVIDVSDTPYPTSFCMPGGSVTRTYTIEDACNNEATCNQIILFIPDNTEGPAIQCPPNVSALDCSAPIPAMVAMLTGTDNCDAATTFAVTGVDNPAAITSFCVGDNLIVSRTYTGVDACGNAGSCIQTITFLPDTQGPALDCPPDDFTLVCTDPIPDRVDFIAGMDNCDPQTSFAVVNAVTDPTPTSFCVADNLIVERVYTVQDACGNTSSCTQTFAYIPDTQAPVFNFTPDPVMTIECFDQLPMPAELIATDNCSGVVEVVFTSVPPMIDICQTGVFVFTWTAVDDCNNVAQVQSQIIRNFDDMPPTVQCPQVAPLTCLDPVPAPISDITTWMNAGGTATDVCSGGEIVITSNDNGGPGSFSYCPQDAPFIVTRSYMLADECGNTAVCDQLISYIPSKNPTVESCETNFEIYVNDPGTCIATITIPSPTFSSDCGVGGVLTNTINGGSTLIDYPFPACASHEIIWTYTDDCGRTATCTQNITVDDNEGPQIDCVPDRTICVDSNGERLVNINELFDGNAIDNCAGVMSAGIRRYVDSCSRPEDLELGQDIMLCCADVGEEVLVELIVTDTKMNTTRCTILIDVCHNFSSLACNNRINLSLDENCSGELTPGMVLANDNYNCSENCEITITDPWGQQVDNNFGYHDVGFEFEYMICCSGDCCWGTVLVEDKFAPKLTCEDVTMSCFDLVSYPGPALTVESCDFATVEFISEEIDKTECSNDGIIKTVTREYVAVDKLGNASEVCVNNISITRLDPTRIHFPKDTIIQCNNGYEAEDAGVPIYVNTYGDTINLYPTPESNCNLWVSLNETPLVISDCEQKIIRRWTIMEFLCTSEKLLAEYAQRIEVIDGEGPHIYCDDAHPLVYTTNGYTCEGNVTIPPIEYHDNCSIEGTVDITYPGGIMKNQNGGTVPVPEGLHTVTYNVYDNCNNVSTCDVQVQVVDNTPPTTLCENHTVVTLTSNGESLIASEVFSDGSYDDCGLKKILAKRLSPGCDCYDHHPKFDDMHYLGEFEGNHYYVSHDAIIAPKANQLAEAMGGHLACIESSFEQHWLEEQLVPLTGSGSYTIGLSDQYHEGVYEWSCGADYDDGYTDWATGQPDNIYIGSGSGSVATQADYVHLNTNGGWADYDGANIPLQYVFEVEDPCGFTEYLRFCCKDQGTVQQIVVRAVDKWGNFNECQVEAQVQNKETFGCVPLPDITVSCGYNYTSMDVFGTLQPHEDDARTINIDDPYVQYGGDPIDGYIIGGCAPEIIEVDPQEDLNQCHRGKMVREFIIAPGTPNEKSIYQKIHFVNTEEDPIEIIWPENLDTMGCMLDLHPDNLPEKYSRPRFNDTGCSLLAAGIISEDIFDFDPVGGESCFKIIRQWSVIDWCNVNEYGVPQQWEGPAQILKADNDVPPVITCNPVVANSFGQDCERIEVVAKVEGFDDCTNSSELFWRYHLDKYSDGSVDETGQGDPIFNGYVPAGEHIISWWAEDRCGNVSERCDQLISTENQSKPSAICIYGISTDLVGMDMEGDDGIVDTEMTIVYPHMVNNKSQDACGDQNVTLSFSDDPDHPDYDSIIFGCSDIGIQEVTLWVTASNGEQSFCVTTIDVQDNNDVDICITEEGGTSNIGISGTTTTETGEEIENVEVTLNGSNEVPQMTQDDGFYNFDEMPMGGDYQVVPQKDDNYLNGLSTLDLVLIQKHILGLDRLDSPYKMIAADINNSGSISASDLVQLRKLILGVFDVFPSNTSWRFVRSDYEFIDAENPLGEPFDEYYDIENLQTNMDASFIGIKIGDVNNTADPQNIMGKTEKRNNKSLSWITQDNIYKFGDIIHLPVRAKDFNAVYGMQLTLNHQGLRYLDIEQGSIKMDNQHLGRISEEMTTVSWHTDKASTVGDDQILFTLVFDVTTTDLTLSNVLEIGSQVTPQKAYLGEAYATHDITLEWENEQDLFKAQLLQNDPNPWKNETEIQFSIPKSGLVEISIYNLNGQLQWINNQNYSIGRNTISVSRNDIPLSGVYIYKMQFENAILQRKMIVMD